MPVPARPIRVLLVTDDPFLRDAIARVLKGVLFALSASVSDALAATRACEDLAPDVAVVDANMRARQGFTAVQDIMAFRPTPILVLTDSPQSPSAFEALSLGALDVMARGSGREPLAGADIAGRLKLLSGVRVITHVQGRHGRKRGDLGGPPVIGIAASLGGPRALAILLKGLPSDLAAPVCVVQHISEGFEQGLAAWLAIECKLPVHEARDRDRLHAGEVLVAPSAAHLAVGAKDEVVLDLGPPVGGFRPSATVLFESLAQHYGPRVIGLVLTGMGRDGADGLCSVRRAGGRTLAQDEATSAVWGMPKAALELGAVERVVPIEEMAEALLELVREGTRREGDP